MGDWWVLVLVDDFVAKATVALRMARLATLLVVVVIGAVFNAQVMVKALLFGSIKIVIKHPETEKKPQRSN